VGGWACITNPANVGMLSATGAASSKACLRVGDRAAGNSLLPQQRADLDGLLAVGGDHAYVHHAHRAHARPGLVD